ncbi:cyclophilin-like fold protein [Thomasclavelia sp.]|uniref:cyclophilin-like fold protein n=1 Tax=Thomasclavelia sp. TaxID=3025757 RepID=UPI0025E837A3|nr:cyclophilin-like fold protein [Thomasclavelia sp.]
MKKIILILCFLVLYSCANTTINKESAVNHQEFQLNLYQNSCVYAFLKQLPQIFEMQDLHNNEKYLFEAFNLGNKF